MTDPLTMSVREAAAIAGIGRTRMYAWLRLRKIPAVRVGRRYRVVRARLAEAVARMAEGE